MAGDVGKMKLKIGILGNASIARNKIIPALRKLSDYYSIVAIGSRDTTKKGLNQNIEIVGYQQIIENNNIDLVYIALPNSMHDEWVLKSLEAGKHVICEKPFSTSLEVLEKITETALDKNLCIRENFQFVMHPQSNAIRDILLRNELGRINLVRVDFGFPPFQDGSNIRYSSTLSGGAALDAGAYTLKFVNEFFPDLWNPLSTILVNDSSKNVDLSGAFQLQSSSGILAQLFFSFDQDYVCRFEIMGSEGRLQGNRIFTAPADYVEPLKLIKNNNIKEIRFDTCDHFEMQFSDFYRVIKQNDNLPDITSIRKQAVLVHKCILECK